jgi:glycosyltransferase involved in cell wall biosynthesis
MNNTSKKVLPNILFVNNRYFPVQKGGAEYSIRLLAEYHVKCGGKAAILTLSDVDKMYEVDEVKVYGVGCVSYWKFECAEELGSLTKLMKVNRQFREVFPDICMRSKISRIIKSFSADVVIVNNFVGLGGFSIPKVPSVKYIYMPRDYYPICTASNYECAKQCVKCKMMMQVKCHSVKKYDDYWSTSDTFAEALSLKTGFNFVNMRNPIELIGEDDFVGRVLEKKNLTVGYIGRLSENKGVGFLLDAASSYSEISTLNITMYIAGDYSNELGRKLIEKAKMLNTKKFKVVFLGFIEQSEYFKKIDINCFTPVWEEPFGRTVLEAAVRGIPSIVDARGGLKELATSGLAIPIKARTLVGFADALNLLMDNYHYISREAMKSARIYSVESIHQNMMAKLS